MRNLTRKILLTLLVIHGFGINIIGAGVIYLVYHPISLGDYCLIWLISFQINAFCFYYFKKYFPEGVDPAKNLQRSPWLTDLFRKPDNIHS